MLLVAEKPAELRKRQNVMILGTFGSEISNLKYRVVKSWNEKLEDEDFALLGKTGSRVLQNICNLLQSLRWKIISGVCKQTNHFHLVCVRFVSINKQVPRICKNVLLGFTSELMPTL